PGFNAGALGRRVVDGCDHAHKAMLHGDFNAQAAELTTGRDRQLAELLWCQVGRMRIESVKHAAYGVRDELLVGDFFDVTLLDPIEDFDKRTQILQWQVLRVSSVRALCKAALGETDHHTHNDA